MDARSADSLSEPSSEPDTSSVALVSIALAITLDLVSPINNINRVLQDHHQLTGIVFNLNQQCATRPPPSKWLFVFTFLI